ncbi:hypothetical protein HALLA_17490 [Halostagnicola larsenii XH-48]|uniref:DUF8053 domain-containing protein n=1 Tax=Halostagnicola larsenii XH-48 TaxID=797299 RepID=W0JSZ6_9EURY|nr:hypothetical protein [Halostagnicola larsenii]AHG00325.1 hypothetical protein HALLA_17490 [Halostagnicola larsenii XH-48]
MALNKLRELDDYSYGVTVPKDDLRIDGILDENGDLEGDHHFHVQRTGKGKWSLEVVDDLE